MNKQVTPRELEVLRWLYYGKTNKEIGQLLDCSAFTIKNHITHLTRKFGVENRTRIVTIALERQHLNVMPCTPESISSAISSAEFREAGRVARRICP